MKKTNFDRYLEQQLDDSAFAARFKRAAMSFDLQRVLARKRAFRQELAARPVAEKLRLLDELRAAAVAIRRSVLLPNESGMVQEDAAEYRTDERK